MTQPLQYTVVNQPPTLNGSAVFMVTIGQSSTYQFVANDSDTFNLTVLGDLGGALEQGMDGMHSYTLKLSAITNSTVSFAAKDTLNASSLLNPQVYVCACENGNCTLEGVLNRNDDPLIMNCICPEGTLVSHGFISFL